MRLKVVDSVQVSLQVSLIQGYIGGVSFYFMNFLFAAFIDWMSAAEDSGNPVFSLLITYYLLLITYYLLLITYYLLLITYYLLLITHYSLLITWMDLKGVEVMGVGYWRYWVSLIVFNTFLLIVG